MEMGDMRAPIMDLDIGVVSYYNDGDAHTYTGRKGVTLKMPAPGFGSSSVNQPEPLNIIKWI